MHKWTHDAYLSLTSPFHNNFIQSEHAQYTQVTYPNISLTTFVLSSMTKHPCTKENRNKRQNRTISLEK